MERSLFEINKDLDTITSWPTLDLRRTARELTIERDANPNKRQAEEADRLLGHVAFEMWARTHHDTQTPAS